MPQVSAKGQIAEAIYCHCQTHGRPPLATSKKAIEAAKALNLAAAIDGPTRARRQRRHNIKTGYSEFMKDQYSQLKSVNLYDNTQEPSLSVALLH